MTKNTLKFEIKFKMAEFLLGLGHGTMRLFCLIPSLGMLHVHSKFHTSWWNVQWGMLCWSFVGGAMEPICHTQSCNPHQISIFRPCDVFTNFLELSSIPVPSKTASCFMANNVSPWQQRAMKTHNLHNKASSCFRVLLTKEIWWTC